MTYIITDLRNQNDDYDISIYYTDQNLEGLKRNEKDYYIEKLVELPLDLGLFNRVRLHSFKQNNFNEYLEVANRSITDLKLFKCPFVGDLSQLERFPKLERVIIYWNRKLKKIWNVNKNLKYLRINQCNSIVDFTSLRDSNIEQLILTSSGEDLTVKSAKLKLDDNENVLKMNKLKKLTLCLNEKTTTSEFLREITKLRHLEELILLDDAYTFEEFAWLKSRLPNLEGIDGVQKHGEFYSVIGKKKPRVLLEKDIHRVNKYREEYEELVLKYRKSSYSQK